MENEKDTTLMELINQLSEKTTALLHHLRTKNADHDTINAMETEVKELQAKIKERMREKRD